MQFVSTQVKPLIRAVRFAGMYQSAKRRAARRTPAIGNSQAQPPVFIVGCGRSGTTLLGAILATNPAVRYHFEPYHLWTAIEPTTDMINLYTRTQPRCIMTASDCTPQIIERFRRMFISAEQSVATGRRCLIEKTPINAMRLGFLSAIAPEMRVVHIVRDGVDVARSINRIASTNSYRIAGRAKFNQWWGNHDIKWRTLAQEGAAAGYGSDEVRLLKDHLQRGAYEWIVSLSEVDRHRAMLGDRLLELRYDQLTSAPESTLISLCEFLQLPCPDEWLANAAQQLGTTRSNKTGTLELPPQLSATFQQLQTRFGLHTPELSHSQS